MKPGAIDWSRIAASLATLPYLQRVVRREVVERQRLGSCSVLVEWLHDDTPGIIRRATVVDDELAAVAAANLPGFDGLVARLASANREDTFATLAELFVAAWYLRSGHHVIDVHADQGQGDVVIADESGVAHVEVRDLAAPAIHYLWGDRWADLLARLRALKLPFLVEFGGVTTPRYVRLPGGPYPEAVPVPAPELFDIDWIVGQVVKASERSRPWSLQEGFSKKYPDLWIKASDDDGPGVNGSWGSSGWAFPAGRMVNRILHKDPPSASGRRVLMVEISRYPGETLIEEWSREQVRRRIAQTRSWDAIVAFGRWWDRPGVAQVYVLHMTPKAERLLPSWGEASSARVAPVGASEGSPE